MIATALRLLLALGAVVVVLGMFGMAGKAEAQYGILNGNEVAYYSTNYLDLAIDPGTVVIAGSTINAPGNTSTNVTIHLSTGGTSLTSGTAFYIYAVAAGSTFTGYYVNDKNPNADGSPGGSPTWTGVFLQSVIANGTASVYPFERLGEEVYLYQASAAGGFSLPQISAGEMGYRTWSAAGASPSTFTFLFGPDSGSPTAPISLPLSASAMIADVAAESLGNPDGVTTFFFTSNFNSSVNSSCMGQFQAIFQVGWSAAPRFQNWRVHLNGSFSGAGQEYTLTVGSCGVPSETVLFQVSYAGYLEPLPRPRIL